MLVGDIYAQPKQASEAGASETATELSRAESQCNALLVVKTGVLHESQFSITTCPCMSQLGRLHESSEVGLAMHIAPRQSGGHNGPWKLAKRCGRPQLMACTGSMKRQLDPRDATMQC